MAHLVESMMYVGETPWHGLGRKVPDGKKLSVRDAIVAAGLDWRVELRPVYTKKPDGNARSGILNGGKQVWVLAKIRDGNKDVGKNDPVAHYILLSNAYDGSVSVRVGFTPIRVVCNNTLTLAHYSKASKLLRVRHTISMHDNMELVREIMNVAGCEFSATVEQYRRLRNRGIDTASLERYVKIVFSLPDNGGKELIPNIIHLFENGRGHKEAGKTYWGACNAVTEYLNYFRGRTQDNTLSSPWFGDSTRINRQALTTALKMAA